MNITNENALEILNTIIASSPSFARIVSVANAAIEAKNQRKAELLQTDRNLTEDEASVEREITGCKNAIAGCKKQINELTGRILQYSKQLKIIRSRREAIHKEWIENYGSWS